MQNEIYKIWLIFFVAFIFFEFYYIFKFQIIWKIWNLYSKKVPIDLLAFDTVCPSDEKFVHIWIQMVMKRLDVRVEIAHEMQSAL